MRTLLTVLLGLLFVGTAHATPDYPKGGQFDLYEDPSSSVSILKDRVNGCEYFRGSSGGWTLREGSCEKK